MDEYSKIWGEVGEIPKHYGTLSNASLGMSAEEFYASLPLKSESRCIRLLTITPSGISMKSGTIIGSLWVHAIDEAIRPSFAALSYVWGQVAEPAHRVILGDGCFHREITRSCFMALANVVAATGTVTIWVDAICINQQDEEEKECQIPLMKDIYTIASSVYIWLGEGSAETDHAVDYLKRVARTRRRLPFGMMTSRRPGRKRGVIFETSIGTLCDSVARARFFFSPPQPPSRDAMDKLLDSEWTRRAWTFQEMLLARKAIFVCGSKTISWDKLVRAICSAKPPEPHALWNDFHALTPSISEGVLGNWKSTIHLWLSLPRDRFARSDTAIPRERTLLRRNSSFIAQVESCHRQMHKGHFIISSIRCLFYLAMISFSTYACVRMHVWILFCFAWVLALNLALWIDAVLSFIILGMEKSLVADAESLSDGQSLDCVMLDAILTALRYRASSEPHDRTFSLLAILDALGVQTAKPSYRLPVGQANAQFIGSLVNWSPDAVSLVLDAGSQRDSDGPSWAPDWSRVPPSWWLTSRYRVAESSRRLPTKATVEGGRLRLKAVCLGKVVFQTSLVDPDSDDNTEEDIESRLAAAYRVFSQIITPNKPNEELVSSVFAVLEGITPARRPTTISKYYPPPMRGSRNRNRRIITSQVPLEEARYEFTDRTKIFEQFQHLHDLMIGAPQEKYKPKPAFPKAYLQTISTSFARDRRGLFAMTSTLIGNENGGLIGSGTLEVEVGDEVFLIPGVPAPMVLRRGDSGTLRVIGAALVHGVSDEEDQRSVPMDRLEEIILV